MPIRLHVNVDHVATVRNARGTTYPDPVLAAQICEQAGADGITAHLREDRRHIRDDDIERLRSALSTVLNLEMAATDEMIGIAARVKPAVITLVPERREERTTEGGLDLVGQRAQLDKAVATARAQGIRTSLFIAPELRDVELGREIGVQQVELHTGPYCHDASAAELGRLQRAARRAAELGLEVAAGHGLTRHNVVAVAAISQIVEVNIGHAIVADAVFDGLDRVVRDFRAALDRGIRSRSA
jgi:pyridoxine 5-phosphate synthase